ncbi:MAG: alpha/beta fold hydrolase [Anaerolineaceae bacterium]|nr:alpha/beta fold hydrolase [Anaerolineaceae bacterium]
MKRRVRWIASFLVVVLLLLGVGYVAGGTVVYNKISLVEAQCKHYTTTEWLQNTPRAFVATGESNANLNAYAMSAYQDVSFPSREDKITISGWYVPAPGVDEASSATVILVHGLNDCKRTPFILMPAGMLNKAGFNVLMIDLRNHGDSQVVDGHYGGGVVEYRDVLGAWDWLVNTKHFAPEKIGLFGTSLGAATVLIAMGEEPRVAAVWEDSSYSDIYVTIDAELTRNHFPTALAGAGIFMGRLLSNRDLTDKSPLQAIAKLNHRPLFITHGSADTRLTVQYAYDLAAAAKANGEDIQPWIVEGSEHVRAMFNHTAEYEQKLVAFFKASLAA